MTIRWPSRIAAFTFWALAALSATFWILKTTGLSEAPVKAGAIAVEAPVADLRDLNRALGPALTTGATAAFSATQAPGAGLDARMRLLGVVAGRQSGGGVALIAIDGQPPRPYRVGSPIDDRFKLASVASRSATLTPTQADGPAFTLELPTAQAPAARFGDAGASRPPALSQATPAAPRDAKPESPPSAALPANAPGAPPAPEAEEPGKN
jgi:general secretion pathway protein C